MKGCPACGYTNVDYRPDGLYCHRCRKVYEVEEPTLADTIDRVLAANESLCMDDAEDRAALKWRLLAALGREGNS